MRGAKVVDARTDIVSLVCGFFQCLTGWPPFEGNHGVAVLPVGQVSASGDLSPAAIFVCFVIEAIEGSRWPASTLPRS